MAMTNCKEWLRDLLLEIPLWSKPISAISILYYSEATLSRAYNKVYNGKSRHINIRHSYVKEQINQTVVTFNYIKSKKNLVDPSFTKA